MTMASSTPPTKAQESALRTTVESTVGQGNQVRNFQVMSTLVNRRALTAVNPSLQQQQQQQQWQTHVSGGTSRRLATYSWQVSFDVVVPLSSTSYATPDAYAASITDAVSSDSFESDVQNNVGVTLDTATVEAVVYTRNPSQLPTQIPSSSPSPANPQPMPLPTLFPPSSPAVVLATPGATVLATDDDSRGEGGGTSAASTQGLIIGVVLGAVVLLGLALGGKRYFDQRKAHGVGSGRKSDIGLDGTAAEANDGDEPKLQFAGEVEEDEERQPVIKESSVRSSSLLRSRVECSMERQLQFSTTRARDRIYLDRDLEDGSGGGGENTEVLEMPIVNRAVSRRPSKDLSSVSMSARMLTTFAETAASIADDQATWVRGGGREEDGSDEDDNDGLKDMVAENPEGEADLFDMLNDLEESPEVPSDAPPEMTLPGFLQRPFGSSSGTSTTLPLPPPSVSKTHEAEL